MKTLGDLKIGDICYLLDRDNNISEVKIAKIEGKLITYSTGCEGMCYGHQNDTTYGGYLATVYFNIEDALDELRKRKDKIDKEIEKWTKE